jgi:hypothetical protein
MRRWQRSVTTVLVAALLMPAPEAAAATATPSDWAHVRTLKPGLKLAIHLQDGAVRKGAFVQADPDGVTLRAKEGPFTVARHDVREIRKARRSAGRKIAGFLVGALAGAFGGIYLGASIGQSGCQTYCEDAGLIGAVYGLLIGAVVGGLSGLALAAQGEGAAVYRAPVSVSGNPS